MKANCGTNNSDRLLVPAFFLRDQRTDTREHPFGFCDISCAWDVIKLARNCVQCTVSPFAKQLAKILGSAGNIFLT